MGDWFLVEVWPQPPAHSKQRSQGTVLALYGGPVMVDWKAALYQCCLRPCPRKIKKTLPVIVGLGFAGQKERLFRVLPELICYWHRAPQVSQHPDTCVHFVAGAVCSKTLTPVYGSNPSTVEWPMSERVSNKFIELPHYQRMTQ
jgi:hypothetical protein